MDIKDFEKFSYEELRKIGEDTWKCYFELVKWLYINHKEVFIEWQKKVKTKQEEEKTERKE